MIIVRLYRFETIEVEHFITHTPASHYRVLTYIGSVRYG